MSSKRILILGAGFLQGVAIRSAKKKGWQVIAVDANPQAVCASEADRFEPIDLKDRIALVNFAKSLQAEGGLDGVFTAATDFSASVAAVAEACGLPGHTFEAALNASDKVRMRTRFAEAGIPSPRYIGINAGNTAQARALLERAGIAFPLVVKPADNMGARGCRTVHRPAELDAAVAEAVRYSRTGTAIVEEYMDGPEFSIEALVYDGEFHLTGLADRHIFFPPYFIEMGHTIPSCCTPSDADKVITVFQKGIAALGLTHGVAKGDIKLTSRGAMVGEIAGRLSGGYMSGWTFPYSSGLDLTAAALDLAVGERPLSLDCPNRKIAAERAWISIPGTVAAMYGLDWAQKVPYVRDIFPRAGVGDRVTFPRNNVEKCGNVLAAATDRQTAASAAERACASIVIRLEPDQKETDAFLDLCGRDPSGYPPSAFSINPDDIDCRVLRQIPEEFPFPIPEPFGSALDTLRDWQGRTPREALKLALETVPDLRSTLEYNGLVAERAWRAFAAAGIQGLIYIHDSNH